VLIYPGVLVGVLLMRCNILDTHICFTTSFVVVIVVITELHYCFQYIVVCCDPW